MVTSFLGCNCKSFRKPEEVKMSKDEEIQPGAETDGTKGSNNPNNREKEIDKSKTNRRNSGKGLNRKKAKDPDGRHQTSSGFIRNERRKSIEKREHHAHDEPPKDKDPQRDATKTKERRKDHDRHNGNAVAVCEGKHQNNEKYKREKAIAAASITPVATNSNIKSEIAVRSNHQHENEVAEGMHTEMQLSGHAMCCRVPSVSNQVRVVDRNVSGMRLRSIRQYEKKWLNGTVLTYYFYQESDDEKLAGGEANESVVRRAFDEWANIQGMSLRFEEVTDINDAKVRIAFEQGKGDWSGIGRDILDSFDPLEPTMNFDSDLAGVYNLKDRYNTALHEIGHTLGFAHEHQSPFSKLVFDVDAAYAEYAKYGWTKDMVNFNIFNRFPEDSWMGLDWDPDSIMHYWFPKGLIKEPAKYYETGLYPEHGLSNTDKLEIQKYYGTPSPTGGTGGPKLSDLPLLIEFETQRIKDGNPGRQSDFLVEPARTGYYTIETMGYHIDTSIVLFEQVERTERLEVVDGDDDSGRGGNAYLRVRLIRGRQYVLKVRVVSNMRGYPVTVLFRFHGNRLRPENPDWERGGVRPDRSRLKPENPVWERERVLPDRSRIRPTDPAWDRE